MSRKEVAKAKNFIRNFQPTETQIENRIQDFQNKVAAAPCFCGAEIIFAYLSETEIRAAVRAGIIQAMFYEYLEMKGDQTSLHYGFIGHLCCALRDKTKDILNCSIIQ